jgi:transcriptional regulator NrdR family protein
VRNAGTSEGAPCPICEHTVSSVMDSRNTGGARRRRRRCNKCGHRYTTYEVDKATYDLICIALDRFKTVPAMLRAAAAELEEGLKKAPPPNGD